MGSKIDAFAHLLGEVPDEKIADMAGVKPATVAAYRARLEGGDETGDDSGDGDDAKAAPDTDTEPPTQAEPTANSKGDDGEEEPEKAKPAPPKAKPAPKPKAPPTVRVTRSATLRRENGMPWFVGLRDVYRGEEAAWLWEHHRELVEPFPPPAKK